MTTVNITTILKAISTCYKSNHAVPVKIENRTLKYYYSDAHITFSMINATRKPAIIYSDVHITFSSPYIVGEDSAISDIRTLTKFNIAGIHLANNKINLLSRTQSYTIPPAPGFSDISKFDPQITETLTVDMQRVKEVYFVAAKNDSRQFLNAVCLFLGNDRQIIAYAAADAHRMAWSGTSDFTEYDKDRFMLLPRALIDFMLKIKVDSFSFGYNPENQYYRAVAELASDDTDSHTIEIIAKGIDCSKGIDYVKVIPQNNDLTVSLDVAALKQVAALADRDGDYVVRLDLEAGEIKTSPIQGVAFSVPGSITSAKHPGGITIYTKYLLDLVKHAKLTDRLEFKALSTGVTRSITLKHDKCHCCGGQLPYSVIHVIMPLRR